MMDLLFESEETWGNASWSKTPSDCYARTFPFAGPILFGMPPALVQLKFSPAEQRTAETCKEKRR
jgi:hypothetical protein